MEFRLLVAAMIMLTAASPTRADGKASASNTPAASATSSPAQPTVSPQPLTDPSGTALDRFYARLLQLQRGKRKTVRISHWGDSHVVPDVLTDKVRTLLQARFGDAGPGLVLVGKPWRTYRHGAAKLGIRGRWRSERIWSRYSRRRRRPRDDLFGIAGISVHTRWRGRAWIEPRKDRLAAIDIHYLRQQRGGRLEVYVDNKLLRRIFTLSSRKRPGFARIELPEKARSRRVELATGGGEVRIFAVDLIRGTPGIVYDVLGINGARADTILKWSEPLMKRQARRIWPDLIVLAYGSNEVDTSTLTRDSFAAAFTNALTRMRRMRPTADCLVVGAPDQARYSKEEGWQLPTNLDIIIKQQRRLAIKHRCAFWDQRAAMGGAGSIYRWVVSDPPMAREDRVHLLGDGYRAIGQALHDALMAGFKNFRIRMAAAPRAKAKKRRKIRLPRRKRPRR